MLAVVVTHQQGAETWQNKLQCGKKHSEEDSKWIKMDVNNAGLEILWWVGVLVSNTEHKKNSTGPL